MKNSTNSLYKYWPTIFAAVNLMAVYRLLKGFDVLLFNVSLVMGLLMLLSKLTYIFATNNIAKYKFFYIYILILWFYQFTFGMSHIHPKTWTYLIAKTVMLLSVVISVERFFQYFKNNYYNVIVTFVASLLVVGSIMNPISFDGRIGLGFSNPNQMGSLCAICFSYLIQLDNLKIKRKVRFFIIALMLFGVLMSGSRASLGFVIIAALYKYRISVKLFVVIALTWLIIFIILPQYGISFQGIDRFLTTVESQEFSRGREIEREATWQMIKDSPIEGNGIYCEQSEAAKRISELGSHNTYLDFLKWFGYPLGIILIASLLLNSLWFLKKYWKSQDPNIRAHLIVVLGVLPLSMYEGLIWGVNEINNTLFFVSFAVLCNYNELKKSTNQ